MPIKLAFSGTGFNKMHARAAQKLPGVELAAVVNHRPESMRAFAVEFNIPRQYAAIDELLNDGQVDAVVVSTPNALHKEQSLAALQRGVHVLVEKPMAVNAAEAAQMVEASEKSGARLMVGHCFRFDPETRWLRQQVQDGRLGQIVRTRGASIHVNWGPGGWFTQKDLAGGGAIADVGIHAIDTARFLLGDPQPVSVYARIGTFYRPIDPSYNVDDTGVLLINWDNGAVSYIETGWWQPHSDAPFASTQLYGKQGFGQLFPTRLELPAPGGVRVEDNGFPVERASDRHQAMLDVQMAYFITCLRSGEKPNPGGLEGWANVKIADAAYQSARTGEVVKVR